jgi:hypothetical protein
VGGSYSAEATLWDPATGKRQRVLAVPGVHAGVFSPDGTLLALATADNIEMWNVRTGRRVRALHGTDLRNRLRLPSGVLRSLPFLQPPRRERVGPIVFAPDGRTLAFTNGNTVRLWRLR